MKNVMLSVAVYVGIAASLVGILGLIDPLPSIGMSERWHGAILFIAGAMLGGVAFWLPAHETRTAATRTLLDEYLPCYQFCEFHHIAVRAPPAAVYRATQDVTGREIRFFRTLTWVRRFGQKGPESIVNAPWDAPLLSVATRTGFLELAREADRELVIGTLVIVPKGSDPPRTAAGFKVLDRPGFAKAALNFRIEPDNEGGSVVSTETRVHATDLSTRRHFAVYWRLILPGSALIRRNWLAAIQRRAECDPHAGVGTQSPPPK